MNSSNQTLFVQKSTTRSQKRKNNQQESTESVSEGFVSPIVVGNFCPSEQDAIVAGPLKPKSPRIESSFLESLRASLKEEITPEIKNLLVESQKEMLKLLKSETRENTRGNTEEEMENETRSFYTPTKSIRIISTQNNDPCSSRNIHGSHSALCWFDQHLQVHRQRCAEKRAGFVEMEHLSS